MISNQHFHRGKGYLRSVSMTTVGLKQLFFLNRRYIMILYCCCTHRTRVPNRWWREKKRYNITSVHTVEIALRNPIRVSYQRGDSYQAGRMINSAATARRRLNWLYVGLTSTTFLLMPSSNSPQSAETAETRFRDSGKHFSYFTPHGFLSLLLSRCLFLSLPLSLPL